MSEIGEGANTVADQRLLSQLGPPNRPALGPIVPTEVSRNYRRT